MTPVEVKRFAATCKCVVCKAITKQDLYINKKADLGDANDWKRITTKFGPKPCQAECGMLVFKGATAFHHTKVGVMHEGCYSQLFK